MNQDEILQLLLADREEAFRKLLQRTLNDILKVEPQEQLQAPPYERSDSRLDSLNGLRARELKTRIGRITLAVPRRRNVPFKPLIFDNYFRSEAALVAAMAEMVVNGVSTRKVSRVIESLCGTSMSKSSVSKICKNLDKEVESFRNRLLVGRYPFLTVDATHFKVRENNRVISKALMIAYGTNEQGHREILGFAAYRNESKDTWQDFLKSLKKRGLKGVIIITSDAHEGIIHAISKIFPIAPWQRCQFHFSRNIADKTPKKYQTGIRAELQKMFACNTLKEARNKKKQIIQEYQDVAETAMSCLDDGFESAMTAMILPRGMQLFFRTSNAVERLNKELKLRSQVIVIFPNEASLIRLMGSVLIERNSLSQSGKVIFKKESYEALLTSDIQEKLLVIAKEQATMLAA